MLLLRGRFAYPDPQFRSGLEVRYMLGWYRNAYPREHSSRLLRRAMTKKKRPLQKKAPPKVLAEEKVRRFSLAPQREMLLGVQNAGGMLVLLDGRRLRVDAQYIPTACMWFPTSELELQNLPSGMAVAVTNLEDDERITAQWDMRYGGAAKL